jgi:hypothetical protein
MERARYHDQPVATVDLGKEQMNQDQLLSVVRAVMQIVGTGLMTTGIGGITSEGWSTITGGVLMIAPVVWGIFAHSESGAVAAVDRLAKNPDSSVKGVILSPTVAGEELAKSLPGNTTAPAGTLTAVEIAKK